MKLFLPIGFCCLCLLALSSRVDAATTVKAECSAFDRHIDFDFDWTFRKGDFPAAVNEAFDERSWQRIDLPHDWSINGSFRKDHPTGAPGGFAEGGIGWYRKVFTLEQQWQGKRTVIHFGGVYMNSEVWINGHRLGKRPYGYISFDDDLTPYLRYGAAQSNTLAVRVDNSQQPSVRWYAGCGIYRHVTLRHTDRLFLNPEGLFFTTPRVRTDQAEVLATAQTSVLLR